MRSRTVWDNDGKQGGQPERPVGRFHKSEVSGDRRVTLVVRPKIQLSRFMMAESLYGWFDPPLVISADQTVRQVIDSLNDHPLAKDETAQDYVMPKRRYCEQEGRFRIWGENQDNFYCFVDTSNADTRNPPVFFETCLDLIRDCGIESKDVLSGNVALVADSFHPFLTFMLAHHICLRLEKGNHLANGVNGIVFSSPPQDCSRLLNPLGREFWGGYTPYIGEDIICIPDWGAAFRNATARDSFINSRQPKVGQSWA